MFGLPGGAPVWGNGAQAGVRSRMSRLTTPRNGSDMTAPHEGLLRVHTGLPGASSSAADRSSPVTGEPPQTAGLTGDCAASRRHPQSDMARHQHPQGTAFHGVIGRRTDEYTPGVATGGSAAVSTPAHP